MITGPSSGSGGSGSQVAESFYHATTYLPAGPTGTMTTTCGNDIAATHQLTLKPLQTPRTCTLAAKLKLKTPPQFRSSSTAVANAALSINIPKPAGIANRDILILSIMKSSNSEQFDWPASWTYIGGFAVSTGILGQNFYHVVTDAASEPASYTWTWGNVSNRDVVAGISSYSGVDNDNPLDGTAQAGILGASTFSTGTVTTTDESDLLIATFGVNRNSTDWTTPTGMTERFDRTVSGVYASIAQSDAIQAALGATGVKSATENGGSGDGGGRIIALHPGLLIGSGAPAIASPVDATLVSTSFATSAVTFAAGDRLELDVIVPNDFANCHVTVSYDSTAAPSKLTVATDVPEGVAGLLLLAPALPFGARWWKRRR
jgi:hypothetical protein